MPLGLPVRARGVEQEQRMLGVERLRLVLVGEATPTVSCHQTSRPSTQFDSRRVRCGGPR